MITSIGDLSKQNHSFYVVERSHKRVIEIGFAEGKMYRNTNAGDAIMHFTAGAKTQRTAENTRRKGEF
jgi:hypothetical protein